MPLSPEIRRITDSSSSCCSSTSHPSHPEPSLLAFYHGTRSLHRTISDESRGAGRSRRDSIVFSGNFGHQLAQFQWSSNSSAMLPSETSNLLSFRRSGLGKSAPSLSSSVRENANSSTGNNGGSSAPAGRKHSRSYRVVHGSTGSSASPQLGASHRSGSPLPGGGTGEMKVNWSSEEMWNGQVPGVKCRVFVAN